MFIYIYMCVCMYVCMYVYIYIFLDLLKWSPKNITKNHVIDSPVMVDSGKYLGITGRAVPFPWFVAGVLQLPPTQIQV